MWHPSPLALTLCLFHRVPWALDGGIWWRHPIEGSMGVLKPITHTYGSSHLRSPYGIEFSQSPAPPHTSHGVLQTPISFPRNSVTPLSLLSSLILFQFQESPSCSDCQTVPHFFKFCKCVFCACHRYELAGDPSTGEDQGPNWSCQVWQQAHTEPSSHIHIMSSGAFLGYSNPT